MKIKLSHGYINLQKIGYKRWYLHSIVVDEGFRSKGIGTKLMNKMISKIDGDIFLLATSQLGGDTKRLFDFYERFGFSKIRMNKQYGVPYNYNMVR